MGGTKAEEFRGENMVLDCIGVILLSIKGKMSQNG